MRLRKRRGRLPGGRIQRSIPLMATLQITALQITTASIGFAIGIAHVSLSDTEAGVASSDSISRSNSSPTTAAMMWAAMT